MIFTEKRIGGIRERMRDSFGSKDKEREKKEMQMKQCEKKRKKKKKVNKRTTSAETIYKAGEKKELKLKR